MQKVMLKRKKINIKTCILSTFILMCFFAFTIIVNNTNKTLGRVPTVNYDTDNNDNNISDWLEYFSYTQDDTNHIITLGTFDKTTYGNAEIEIDVYSKAYLEVAGEKVLYDVD